MKQVPLKFLVCVLYNYLHNLLKIIKIQKYLANKSGLLLVLHYGYLNGKGLY